MGSGANIVRAARLRRGFISIRRKRAIPARFVTPEEALEEKRMNSVGRGARRGVICACTSERAVTRAFRSHWQAQTVAPSLRKRQGEGEL